jgi:hypothetical protein
MATFTFVVTHVFFVLNVPNGLSLLTPEVLVCASHAGTVLHGLGRGCLVSICHLIFNNRLII